MRSKYIFFIFDLKIVSLLLFHKKSVTCIHTILAVVSFFCVCSRQAISILGVKNRKEEYTAIDKPFKLL